MRKIQIIVIAAAGLVSFAGAFGLTWWIKQQLAPASAAAAATPQSAPASAPEQSRAENTTLGGGVLRETMQEQELKNLIFEVRERMTEYKSKERALAEEEQRIETARKTFDADVERLSQLHDALNVAAARLRQQELALSSRIIEIAAIEKTNLQRIAATYDKMDVTQASKIIINMAANKQVQDAVKIVHLMNERTAAKLLGEISTTRPELAALLSTELKQVRESE
jgi:predicted RNase H-like nuclease (RuvC/YqgF family)